MEAKPNVQIMLSFPSNGEAKEWMRQNAIVNWNIYVAGMRVYLKAPPVIDAEDWHAIGSTLVTK